MTDCAVCFRAMTDQATICLHCTEQTTKDLLAIADLWRQLDIVRCRQTRYGERVGGKSRETPLPYADVSEAEITVEATLCAWAKDVTEGTGHEPPPDPGAAARWLAGHVHWFRHRDDAALLVDEAHAALVLLTHRIDSPLELHYVGPCGAVTVTTNCACDIGDDCDTDHVLCDADVFAMTGATSATCKSCRTVHDVATRHAQLLAEVADRLESAATCARAVTVWGEPVKADLIRKWRERGKLLPHGHDLGGNPLYRIGDVVDLARAAMIRGLRHAG